MIQEREGMGGLVFGGVACHVVGGIGKFSEEWFEWFQAAVGFVAGTDQTRGGVGESDWASVV